MELKINEFFIKSKSVKERLALLISKTKIKSLVSESEGRVGCVGGHPNKVGAPGRPKVGHCLRCAS